MLYWLANKVKIVKIIVDKKHNYIAKKIDSIQAEKDNYFLS